ncbi:DNA ligase D [Bacillus sp. FSL K6-3431]|uniref:DNA ligase D n=1 Tax=Bacillus sp. FSL K6-3431 TaxID=2921500 RepID=UPI0030FBFAD0
MLPTLTFHPPNQGDWYYEIKYDGFRGILNWSIEECILLSRNGKDLLPLFPELKAFLLKHQDSITDLLPLKLDGELVILENDWKANFQAIQKRGRLRSKEKIYEAANTRPCKFLAFDLLSTNQTSTVTLPYMKRKAMLLSIFKRLGFSVTPSTKNEMLVQYVPFHSKYSSLLEKMQAYDSEGIVVKLSSSPWEEGRRTSTWLKIKNWKTASCFLTAFDENNGFFHIGVWKNDTVFPLGLFINGLETETKLAIKSTIMQNYDQRIGSLIKIKPGICLDLYYIEWNGEQLREPYFKELRFDLSPDKCTFEHFLIANAAFPDKVILTHPDKDLWDKNMCTKLDYLRYLRSVSSFMLPFLQDRPLTVIRAPHGIFGEAFFQKKRPETAPDYIQSYTHEKSEMIICNDLQALIWLGNQLAIEFHVPFQTIKSDYVSEIVFDLDPPSRADFTLAIHAAILLKEILDTLKLTAFVKVSGNKGMQVYIPLPDDTFTWDDTRLFTEFIANFLITTEPQSFTIERLKKNRNGKLYIDFIQHAEGKTIISPYSVRNNKDALVAAPLFWHEITNDLHMEYFTMQKVLERLNVLGDPFSHFFTCKRKQPFNDVLKMIKLE